MSSAESAKILVVDDEQPLLELLTSHLQRNNYEVLAATDGFKGLKMAFQDHPDLVVLDVMMPELDGLTVCKRLREMSDIPIIILTALSQEEDVVRGFEMGANDYVTKPFSIEELIARIRALLRRRDYVAPWRTSVLTVGDLSIDLPRHRVMVRGETVELTPTEYDLLVFLARHSTQVVRHRRLLSAIWGPEYVDQLDYLRLYVRYLRCKIEEDPGNPKLLRTERGVGYYLAEE